MVSTWIIVFIVISTFVVLLTIIFYILNAFGIEVKSSENSKRFALISSISLTLRSFVKMDFDNGMKSYTYKAILLVTLICGFVTFAHYETVFASILIVESQNIPYTSWQDISESGRNIFVWKGAIVYDMFKGAPEGSEMKKIYEDGKIKDVKAIGYENSIPLIMDGTHFTFDSVDLYKRYKEFPCQISPLITDELK